MLMRTARKELLRLKAVAASIYFCNKNFTTGRTSTLHHIRIRMKHHVRQVNGGRRVSLETARAIEQKLNDFYRVQQELRRIRNFVRGKI